MTDPDPQSTPDPERPDQPTERMIEIADASDGEGAKEAGYGNLWIPLLVVPAGIVFAIVGIFALFGSLSGSEGDLSDNLALVVSGGKNERQQALFNLARQAAENQAAIQTGEDAPWSVDPGFNGEVRAAMEGLGPDEYEFRLVLAILLCSLEDGQGVETLVELARLTDEQDESGAIRLGALQNLGLLAENQRAVPGDVEAIAIALVTHSDSGLRMGAAGVLAVLGGDKARQALGGALEDADLQVRATAALSLSRLTPPDPTAVPMLKDMTGMELWESARQNTPGQFRRSSDIQRYRVWAAEAIGRYGPAYEAFMVELKESDDLQVRGAALRYESKKL